jgi:uncharacterized protein
MICPVCRSDMLVVERNKIELDFCPQCSGTWFDSGELELLLTSVGINECRNFLDDVRSSPPAKTSESVRRCPICLKRMKKTNIGQKPGVLIDACLRGDGLWFDGGELKQLLTLEARGPAAGQQCDVKILAFLGDTFQAGSADKPGSNRK